MAVRKKTTPKEQPEVIAQNELPTEQEANSDEPIVLDSPVEETSMGFIYHAIPAAMADVEAVIKTKGSTGVPYKFRSIEDVMNSLHPTLVKHRIFVVPEVLTLTNNTYERGNTGKFNYQAIMKTRFRFYTIDGSFVEATVASESIDQSDKATQQALSYCFKAALLQVFCIPTMDIQKDGDEKLPPREGEKPAERSASLPKLQDRQKTFTEREADKITENILSEDGWKAIDGQLAPFNLDQHSRYGWIVKTLRANGLHVPEHLKDITREAGKALYRIAKASNDAFELFHVLPPEPAEQKVSEESKSK